MQRNYKSLAQCYIAAFIMMLAVVMAGCSASDSGKAAPIGKLSALEDLADSYTKTSEQLPMNIQVLPASQKREFLEQVFKSAGYDYSATLIAMGQANLDKSNKNQKDLAELVLLPTTALSADALADIYADDELNAINQIRGALR